MESLTRDIWERIKGSRPGPFPVLHYQDVMKRYGTDKPDLRYEMPLVDVTAAFARDTQGTVGPLFAQEPASPQTVLALCAQGAAPIFSRRAVKDLSVEAQGFGAKVS